MGHIVIQGHVDAPIERAFAFACDSTRTHEWAGWITEVDAGDGFAAVGQHVHGKGHLLGRSMDMDSEIVEFERPRLLTLKGTTSLGSKWTWRTEMTPGVGGGTDFTWDYDYSTPGALQGIFDRLVVERAMERNLKNSRDTVVDVLNAEVLQPA
jgi:uncharacterized protein YndB with AHSA1/START domain